MGQDSYRSYIFDLFFLSLGLSLLFGFMLGERPLAVPDEGRYMEIPREMLASWDFITPRLNGVKYFEKPPLFYWLQTIPIKLFGISEWAGRLCPMILGIIGSLMVYGAGRSLFDRKTGLYAAIILATSTLYYVFTRLITLDMAVSVFVTGALLSFLLAQKSSPGPKRRWLMYACSLSFALGFLTKGAMSIAIPGGVMFLWVLIFNRWSKLLPLYLPTSLVLFLTIATPWHVLVALKNPEFLWFYFVNEHVLRYLTTTHNRYGPIWYFIPVILLGLLPWTAFLPQAIKDLVRKYRQDKQAWEVLSYLFLWAGLIFVFFSISSSKLVPYILPLFPALALIMGRFFASIPGTALQPIKKSLWGYLGLNLFLAGVLSFVLFGTDLAEPEHWTYACFVIGVWILSALVVPLLGRLRGVRGVFEGMVGTAVCFFMIASVAAPTLQKRSIKPIAEQIKQNFPPHTIVANYHTYNQDLPVYLDRTIKVVGWTGELQFGMEQEDTSDWMWDEVTFWENWAKEETMCMVTNKGYYEQIKENPNIHFLLVTENQGDYLVCNRKKDAQ